MSTRDVIDLRIVCFLNKSCTGKLDRILKVVVQDDNSPIEDPVYECDSCGKKYWNSDFPEMK